MRLTITLLLSLLVFTSAVRHKQFRQTRNGPNRGPNRHSSWSSSSSSSCTEGGNGNGHHSRTKQPIMAGGIQMKWLPQGWTAQTAQAIYEPGLTTDPMQRYMTHGDTMMAAMDPIPITGDYCVDFARQMIPHHWGACVMALDNVNLATVDATITPIAQDVVSSQSQEIQQFETFLQNQGIPWLGPNDWTWVPNRNPKWSKNLQNTDFSMINDQMSNSMMSVPLIGDLNLDFVRQMIPHHCGAIEMAQDVLAKAKCDPVVQSIAQSVVTTQTQQINQFKAWLAQQGCPWIGDCWTANPVCPGMSGSGMGSSGNGMSGSGMASSGSGMSGSGMASSGSGMSGSGMASSGSGMSGSGMARSGSGMSSQGGGASSGMGGSGTTSSRGGNMKGTM